MHTECPICPVKKERKKNTPGRTEILETPTGTAIAQMLL